MQAITGKYNVLSHSGDWKSKPHLFLSKNSLDWSEDFF